MAKFIADLEIHSKYARAVSEKMELPYIWQWAVYKGLDLVGTGDWTHPLWFRQIKEQLEEHPRHPGLFRLKSGYHPHNLKVHPGQEPLFFLSTEISSLYSQGGQGRRVHNMVWLPDLYSVERFNQELLKQGVNLLNDGRLLVGLSSKQIAEIALEVNEKALIVPAHVWTPWYSLYGSRSGFDSIKECFEDLSGYIYAVETGLSCYDSKTEVLTESGWKKFSKVTQSDKICTLNPDTEVIEYQKPQKIYKYKYQGKMYHLKTKRADLLVTPNHNLFYAPADFRTKRHYRFKQVSELFGKSKIFRKDGKWKGETPSYFLLPEVKIPHGSKWYSGVRTKAAKRLPVKPWIKFFGLWIAEGWTNEGGNGDYNVCIAVQKPLLRKEILRTLKELGYNYYSNEKVIRVRDYQLFSYLRQFGKAAQKYIPLEIKKLSKELLEIFLQYYLKGDGHIYGGNRKGRSATTISALLRDDLQEIALKTGDSAYYKLHNKKGAPFVSASQKKDYKQSAHSWNIYFLRYKRHCIIPSVMKKRGYEESWVDYYGMVYCVSVPNRTVYIRRNGIPLWCGNSDPCMNWRVKELDRRAIVSFSDAHSGPKMGREATVFEIKEDKLSYESIRQAILNETALAPNGVATKSRGKVAYTIEFYPQEGKYHYSGHRNCGVKQSVAETKVSGTTCPVCRRPLTIGVEYRVEKLAERQVKTRKIKGKNGLVGVAVDKKSHPELAHKPPFVCLVPLQEVLAEALTSGVNTQTVQIEFHRLLDHFGSEFKVLLETPLEEVGSLSGPKTAQALQKVRAQDIFIDPGFDGVFGKVKVWPEKETPTEKTQQQLGLDI